MTAYKGLFSPKNPSKYKGDWRNIVFRSSYELKLMARLDTDSSVIQWSSEEFFIPYRSPLDGKMHRYFPDFWVKKKSSSGLIETIVIEVKPAKQTVAPVVKKRITKQYLKEVATWGINEAKWNAAEKFCEGKGWKFIKMTEKELGIK